MLRRALFITTIGVALSAAVAFAFAPELSRVGRAWSLGGLWAGRGFTPAPRTHDPLTASGDVSLDNQSGTPGTYCPIRPRDPSASTVTQDQLTSSQSILDSTATASTPAKTDLLLPAPAASCTTPAPASPGSRSILP